MKTPNLLSIHLEIRELIYTIYLTSPNPLPPTSITRAHRISRGTHHNSGWFTETTEQNFDDRFFYEHCNHYPDPTINPAVPASLSLLLCNRQIHTEVSSIITFLINYTKKLRYEIDCEIVDEVKLYPTWLHIPVRFKDIPIPCLYVTFRISGQFDEDDGRRSGWAHISGGYGKMVWSIIALLNRFLIIGPNFIRPPMDIELLPPSSTVITSQPSGESKIKLLVNKLFKASLQPNNDTSFMPEFSAETSEVSKKQISTDIRIDKLVLDFAPSLLAPDELGARRDVAGEMIDPTQVAAFMKGQLDCLFDSAMWTLRSGFCIGSKVNSVRLLCCGKEFGMWDLAGTKGALHRYDVDI